MLRLAVVLIAGLGMLIWAMHHQSPHELVITNQSGQPITELRITAADQSTSTARDIAAGGDVRVPAVTRGDMSFQLELTLADNSRRRWTGIAGDQLKLFILPGGDIKPAPEKR
jgi:hypothetical protein